MAGPPQFFYRYLLDTARRSARSIVLILLIDLLPLLGLWYLDWNAFNLVFIYFVETIILLSLTWLKMRKARYLLAVLGPRQQVKAAVDGDGEVVIADTSSNSPSDAIDQNDSRPATVMDYWLIRWVFWALRSLLWLIRPMFQGGFLAINIPLVWLQLYLLSVLGGDGWMPWNFLTHRLGTLGWGWLQVPLLPIAIVLLIGEHFWFYSRKYLGQLEFENTGSINEGLRFQIRTVVQFLIMIGAVGLLISDTLSFVAAVMLVLIKVVLDIIAFLWNRMWGAAKNKVEGSDQE